MVYWRGLSPVPTHTYERMLARLIGTGESPRQSVLSQRPQLNHNVGKQVTQKL